MIEHVTIVGAGLSGLIAAHELASTGVTVDVLDKGLGVGGRLATRRIAGATLDHGAQFFTVRGPRFREFVDDAIDAGVVDVWCHGFGLRDKYPRYRCPAGMTALAKWLADRVREAGVTITTDVRVESVGRTTGEWQITDTQGHRQPTDAVILTPPVPQTLDLLRVGGVELVSPFDRQLDAISYKPTMALLVVLDGPSAVPRPGGVQRTERDLFTFIADNQTKGISSVPALTFHVNGPTSQRRWDDPIDEVHDDLLRIASPWFGGAGVVESQLKRWRYAGPYVPFPAPALVVETDPGPVVLAGDAFSGPKVEGAFNSGIAAAAEIASRIG